MALIGNASRRRVARVDLWLSTNVRRAIVQRAKELGYPAVTTFLRCLIRNELSQPRMPHARVLLGPPRIVIKQRRARPGVSVQVD